MILASVLCLGCMAWMAARIWRRSAMLALVAVLAWPLLFFACVRFWGDELSDIRLPFAMFLPAIWMVGVLA